jgi:hypothetical protein
MFYLACSCLSLLVGIQAASLDDDLATAYEALAAKAGRDVGANVRLASWCDANGLATERQKHLQIALETSPDHAAARGLLGQIADQGTWRRAEGVMAGMSAGDQPSSTLGRYQARRERIPDTAEAHWQLAKWCEENGLDLEAKVHFAAVIRLNPSRDDAWKKLGYRKVKGVWQTGESGAPERTESDAQRKADARWRAQLQKWHDWLDRKIKRADGEAALAKVNDPRAVPSVWRVFAGGDAADQAQAARLLRRIDAPAASRALASLSVLSTSEQARRLAADSLAGRDSREFAAPLIAMLRDPIVYEVKKVKGPGEPGELYVHGERVNQRFFYSAPPPLATLGPNDVVSYDSNGFPVANRVVGYRIGTAGSMIDPLLQGSPDLTGAPQVLAQTGLGQAGLAIGQTMVQNQRQASAIGSQFSAPALIPLTAPIPIGQLMVQAQQQAALSKAQLEEDVAALDRFNADVNQLNERAAEALRAGTGEKMGPDRKLWGKWLSEIVQTTSAAPTHALVEDVKGETTHANAKKLARVPSFGHGTPVWTLAGLRPIESVRAGDKVLTQDVSSGALNFAPVLAIHHLSGDPVKSLTCGDASIVATTLERFWVPGRGWVRVFELKPGDVLRLLGTVARLGTVEAAGARPVAQIEVRPGLGIFVGQRGVLAHDGRLATPVAAPFDALPDPVASQAGR